MSEQKVSGHVQQLTQQKVELMNRVRELRVEIGKVTAELVKAGADSVLIASW